MATLQTNKLTGFNVYLDGETQLGRAAEVELPELKATMSEHKGLGLFGAMDYPTGLEKLSAKIKWASYYKEVVEKVIDPFGRVSLMVRGNIAKFNSQGKAADEAIAWHLSVSPSGFNLGTAKHQEDLPPESSFSVYRLRTTQNGVDVLEIDLEANIFKVNGVDKLATWRQNLGA